MHHRPDRIDVQLVGTPEKVREFAALLSAFADAEGFKVIRTGSRPARQEGRILFFARATKEVRRGS